jgi:hypothetical protein
MKRTSALAILAAVMLAGLAAGHEKTFAADETDVDALYNEAAETLGEEGAPAFWRASFYLGKIGEDGAMTLDQGLDDKELLVGMGCARRLMDIFKFKGTDIAKNYMRKSVSLLLRVAADKTAEADARLIAVQILGSSGAKDQSAKTIAAIAADKDADARLRLAAAEGEYLLSGEFTQKEFVAGLLKGDDPKLRFAAAALVFLYMPNDEAFADAANALQECRDDMSIEGLLANRLLKNRELRVALASMKGVDPNKVTQQMVDDLHKEYEDLFTKAADITARVKALRSYARAMEEMRTAKPNPPEGGGEGGPGQPPVLPDQPGANPLMISFSLVDNAAPAADAAPDAANTLDADRQFKDALALIQGGDAGLFWETFRRVLALDKDGAQLCAAELAQGGPMQKIVCAGVLLKIYGKAADDAGKKFVPDSEYALWKIIKDERGESEVRQAATDVLGRYGSPGNSKALMELADTAFDPFVRLSAIRASYLLTHEIRGRDFLREKLDSDDLDVKCWAVITLCEMGDYENARVYFDAFKYEPTLRGKMIQAYIAADGLLNKLGILIFGGPRIQQYAELQIDVERMNGEIKERQAALDQMKAAADAQLDLMKLEQRPKMEKEINDIYNGVKTEGGEEEPGAGEPGAPPQPPVLPPGSGSNPMLTF